MKNIVLTGMPGCGKSTIGVVLAKTLGMDFIDADLVIQKQTKKRLSELIADLGVEGFIDLEDRICAGIDADAAVIATGGSAVYGEKAMTHFHQIGTVVYLRIALDHLRPRLKSLTNRGVVMRTPGGLDELYAERTPLYERQADVIIDVDGKEIAEIIDIVSQIQSHDAR